MRVIDVWRNKSKRRRRSYCTCMCRLISTSTHPRITRCCRFIRDDHAPWGACDCAVGPDDYLIISRVHSESASVRISWFQYLDALPTPAAIRRRNTQAHTCVYYICTLHTCARHTHTHTNRADTIKLTFTDMSARIAAARKHTHETYARSSVVRVMCYQNTERAHTATTNSQHPVVAWRTPWPENFLILNQLGVCSASRCRRRRHHR